jgi:hemolysin activation/secretion protein
MDPKECPGPYKMVGEVLEEVENDLKKAIKAGTLIDNETLQKLTDEFKNRELTLEDMNSVADLITMAYQERGYILAKAYVPEQEIKDGVLKIAISEGRTGKIEVSGEKYYKGEVLKRYFQPQLKHGVIREELLEKGLCLPDRAEATGS